MPSLPNTIYRSIETLHQPEYTGENRCIPCTIVNVGIAGLLSAAIYTVSELAAIIILLDALGIIYFRGYLIPGTPTLSARYLPEWLLDLFETHETRSLRFGTDDAESVVDPETILRESGLITTCKHGDDVCLAEGVRNQWYDKIQDVDEVDTLEIIADTLGIGAERLSFHEHNPGIVAEHDGVKVGQWESRAARTADVASSYLLSERCDEWKSLGVHGRGELLRMFRIFLDRCPACGGSVSVEQDTVQSCCRSIDVVASTCDNCKAHLLEAKST